MLKGLAQIRTLAEISPPDHEPSQGVHEQSLSAAVNINKSRLICFLNPNTI